MDNLRYFFRIIVLCILLSSCASSTKYITLGNQYVESGNYDTAILEYNKAIAKDPRNYLGYESRGRAKFFLGDLEGALEDLNKAVEIKPLSAARPYVYRGQIKHELQDFDGAIRDYNMANATLKTPLIQGLPSGKDIYISTGNDYLDAKQSLRESINILEQKSSAELYKVTVDAGMRLLKDEVKEMLVNNNYYCGEYPETKEFANPGGSGKSNNYAVLSDKQILFDSTTSLYWQKSGSLESMSYKKALKMITELNSKRIGGYDDWRIPTLMEAMSLVESMAKEGGLHIDTVFDNTQKSIWTSNNLDTKDLRKNNLAFCIP